MIEGDCRSDRGMSPTMANAADEMFAINELVNALAKNRNAQKRADARYALHVPVKLGTVVGGAFRPVADGWGMDLSLQGMGLMLEAEVMPGKQMMVQFEGKDHRVVQVAVRVIHCEPMFKTITRVGVMFLFE